MSRRPPPGAVPRALRPILREMLFAMRDTGIAALHSPRDRNACAREINKRLRAIDPAIGPTVTPISHPAVRAREILALPTSHEQLAALSAEPPAVYEALVAEIRHPAAAGAEGPAAP